MQVKYHKKFKKNYKKRIASNKKLVNRFHKRLEIKIKTPSHFILKDHQLAGKLKQFRSFSITGNIRAIYKIKNNTIELYDIGTHNQVY